MKQSWLGRKYSGFLAGTFPGYWQARQRALIMRNAYEAETATRRNSPKRNKKGPNASTRTAPRSIRELARHLEENSDIADHALNVLVVNIIGGGLLPQPMVLNKSGDLHEEFNEALETWYKRWAKAPEVTASMSEAMAQRLSCRSWLRDGEVLHQHILGPKSGLDHAIENLLYSYELIESDLLPLDDEYRTLTSASRSLPNANIIQGIEFNAWNRALAYHLMKVHPGEINPNSARRARSGQLETKRVDARVISHIKLAKRINQARGVSIFHNVIQRLDDIIEIEESERTAARISAAIAAVIIKGEPLMYNATPSDQEDQNGYRELDIEPGLIFDDLMPGEDVKSVGSQRPNNEVVPFIGAQLRRAAGGLNVSYSSLSKDYNGTYSSQRQELVEQHRMFTPLWEQFVTQSEIPKYENFVKAAAQFPRSPLKIPNDVDLDTLFDVQYYQPVVPWIQPHQEAQGWSLLKELGAETRRNIQLMRGHNPRDIEKQRKREREQDEKDGTLVSNQEPNEPANGPSSQG